MIIVGFMITKDLEVRLGSEVKVDRWFFSVLVNTTSLSDIHSVEEAYWV